WPSTSWATASATPSTPSPPVESESVSEPYLVGDSAGSIAPVRRSGEPVLSVENLTVHFSTDDGLVRAVDGVSYELYENEVLGIVGESGSGKSVSSMAILGLLPKTATITGQILFKGRDLLTLKEEEARKLRGQDIAMVFQDALAALNPVYSVGQQIGEAIQVHHPE